MIRQPLLVFRHLAVVALVAGAALIPAKATASVSCNEAIAKRYLDSSEVTMLNDADARMRYMQYEISGPATAKELQIFFDLGWSWRSSVGTVRGALEDGWIRIGPKFTMLCEDMQSLQAARGAAEAMLARMKLAGNKAKVRDAIDLIVAAKQEADGFCDRGFLAKEWYESDFKESIAEKTLLALRKIDEAYADTKELAHYPACKVDEAAQRAADVLKQAMPAARQFGDSKILAEGFDVKVAALPGDRPLVANPRPAYGRTSAK